MRPSTFVGARDQVTDTTLIGPFDGQVVDVATSEPIADAIVVGVWAYDRGDGFIGPHGSETYSTTTDPAGRYRIPPAKLSVRGSTVRLVAFHLVVYKRGFLGYRSDALYEGGARADFAVRHNRVELRKWRETDSHAEHLLFLAAPKNLRKGTEWEQDLANIDLFRKLGGAGGAHTDETPTGPAAPASEWLDATALLSPDDIRLRTGYPDAFEISDITDLDRKSFYHGVHFQAVGREESYDLAFRVWKVPPGGLDPVVATIVETMGPIKPTSEITPETWVLAAEGVHAVAFVDRDAQVGVMLSCGANQCADVETAIILAKTIHRNLDKLRTIPAPAPAAAKPTEPLAPRTTTPAEPGSTRPATTGNPPATPANQSAPTGTTPPTAPAGNQPATPPSGTPSTPPSAPAGKQPATTPPSGTPATPPSAPAGKPATTPANQSGAASGKQPASTPGTSTTPSAPAGKPATNPANQSTPASKQPTTPPSAPAGEQPIKRGQP